MDIQDNHNFVRRIRIRDDDDCLDVRVAINAVKGQILVICEANVCVERGDAYICYTNFEDCPFYKAFMREKQGDIDNGEMARYK